MANLFELLTNAGNKIKTGLQNNAFLNNLTQRTPYIEDSNAEWDKSMALEARKAQDEAQFAQKMQRIQNNPNSLEARMYNFGNNLKDFNLGDALLGRQAAPTDTMSADSNGLKITTSENPKTGGILRDIVGGYQENRFTPASLENLGQNTLEGGRQKGFAYKLGEGLGSISRLANSPLGRGLIVGGLVAATGGNPLQALAYGGGATMLNQQNVLKDRTYRNQLYQTQADKINNEYAGKLAEIEDDNTLDEATKLSKINTLKTDQEQALQNAQNQIYGMRGYMSDDLFGNILRQQQLKDNAEYRKMYFDVNQANMQANREYQRQQDALDRAYQERAFNYKVGRDNIEDQFKFAELAQGKPLSDSQVEKINTAQGTIRTLEDIEQRYSDEKYKNAFGMKGQTRATLAEKHPIAYAPFDNEITLVRQDLDMLRQRYAKAMEGGRMSDADRAFYRNVLMSQNLSYENFMEAVGRLKKYEIESYNRMLTNYGLQGKNVSEFKNANYQNNSSGTSATSKTVRVKDPNGKIGTIPVENLEAALNQGYERL